MRRLLAMLVAAVAAMTPGVLVAAEEQVVAAGFPATLVELDAGAPIVLFIAGSGPTDRDGNSPLGVGASYLAKLAAGLAEQGVGSLRFDKRGVAGSTPVEREDDVTITTFVEDALSVLAWLKSRSGSRPIILLGHSEGGLVALSAAGRQPEIAGLVLVSTPGLPPADTLRLQLRALALRGAKDHRGDRSRPERPRGAGAAPAAVQAFGPAFPALAVRNTAGRATCRTENAYPDYRRRNRPPGRQGGFRCAHSGETGC